MKQLLSAGRTTLLTAVRSVLTYIIGVALLGTYGSCRFWLMHRKGRVKICGHKRYINELKRGHLIVASNHPTILESMLLLFMCWPRCVWQPRKFFPWSMPDQELFYKMGMPSPIARLLYFSSNSIPVDRSGATSNQKKADLAVEKLESGLTVLTHPEAGRTGKELTGKRTQSPRYIFNQDGTRQLRNFATLSRVPKLATDAGAEILPVWFNLPFWQKHDTFIKAWRAWMNGEDVIEIYIGTPYRPDSEQSFEIQNQELARQILNA